ncbi:MAG: hypothetical protein AB7P31_05220 [Steroidobacteraceae bacterium]
MSAGTRAPLTAPDNAALAALVLELASQLQVERAQRIALELVLARGSKPTREALAALADDPEFRRRSQAALDAAMAGLMRAMTGEDRN